MPDKQHNQYYVACTHEQAANNGKGVIQMKRIATSMMLFLVLVIGFMCVAGQRQAVALSPDYATPPVLARNATESPNAGFTSGESNSRINDYIMQDEQINLDKDSGVVKVLRTDEKININDYVEAIIRCNNVNPRELRGPIRTLCRKEGGDADVIQDKVKNEFFLHVTCPRFQLPYIEEAIRGLDEEWVKERMDGSAELYYQGKHRDVNDLLNITQFYRGPEGVFTIDDLNNGLYYNDQPAVMGLQKWGLSQVDIPPNQILFDVAIYEVKASNEYKLGLDYLAWKNGPGRNLFLGIAEYAHLHGNYYIDFPCNIGDKGVSLRDIIDNPLLKYRYGAFNFLATAAYVDFMSSRGKAKLLTKTNVLVKSGNIGEVKAVHEFAAITPGYLPGGAASQLPPEADSPDGAQLPAKDGSDVCCPTPTPCVPCEVCPVVDVPDGVPYSTEYAYNRVVDYVKAGSVGVRVTLKPYIGLESAEVAVDIAVSDVNGYSPMGLPLINTRFLTSYVRVADGVPYVLGGITRKEEVKNSNKIPLLGEVPVLGWLFGGENDAASEEEIVVVMTPHFMLSSQSSMEMPEEAQTVINQVEKREVVKIPSNPFGFDQWLLDSEK
jgi:type II secretory pathway component GspD/PulD (secretin)